MKYMELFIVADHTLVSAGGGRAETQSPAKKLGPLSVSLLGLPLVTLPHPRLSAVQEPEPQPGPHQATHRGDRKLRGQGNGRREGPAGPP